MMPELRRLLSYGLFPSELPPPFNSESYGEVVSQNVGSLPDPFTPNSNGNLNPTARLGTHNLARTGQLRRVLGIVNPVRFFNLAHRVVESWEEIQRLLDRESFSSSRPTFTDEEGAGAIVPEASFPDRKALRAKYRHDAQFVLKADIQNFYGSIYTHSIAWAIHGKPEAKKNIGDSGLLGNRLDDSLMSMQDRQTTGIPIGPDTSLVIAELILTAIDIKLRCKIPRLRGFRSYDDYEMSFGTRSDAEGALSILQRELSEYELKLNTSKTQITELPAPFDSTWPERLKNYNFRSNTSGQINDIYDYFNISFEIAEENPEDSVLRYAINRANSEDFDEESWPTYQSLLLQCAISESGTLRHVLAELKKYRDAGYNIDQDKVQQVITVLIDQHAPMNRGSEVAWALWWSITLDIELPTQAAHQLHDVNDPLVPVLALHAEDIGLIPHGLDKDLWADRMTREHLYGKDWLLAYEANVHGWLPSNSKNDHVEADPCFQFLKKNEVSFFTPTHLSESSKRWTSRLYPRPL